MIKIGVVGGGFVGGAVARGFMEHGEVRVFDTMPERRTHSIEEVLDCEFVFVCLPTPMREDGACSLTLLFEFFEEAKLRLKDDDRKPLFVIKSTVPVGTTAAIADVTALQVIHSPEFLTARCAHTDFQTPARNIVGIPKGRWWGKKLIGLYQRRFPGVAVQAMTSDESELVKYVCNSFFAVKVAYFNEIYRLAGEVGADFERVRAGVLSDGRIAHAHTQVPCGGQAGFGGSCLPKDLNALMHTMRSLGIEPLVTAGAWELNKQVRTHQDWQVAGKD